MSIQQFIYFNTFEKTTFKGEISTNSPLKSKKWNKTKY